MLIDECFTELDSKQSEMAPKNIKNVRKANTREMQVFSTSVSPEGKKKRVQYSILKKMPIFNKSNLLS